MATPRRKCRLADINHADIDLRNYEKVITETIEQVVPEMDMEAAENLDAIMLKRA